LPFHKIKTGEPRRGWNAAVFGTTYILAAALYVWTAAKAPGVSDWGDFVAAASVLGVAHPTGYATYLQLLALPLATLPAAWAAAAADVANALVAALAPALLAFWTFRAALPETRRTLPNAALAGALGALAAAAPALWREATSVEVYGAGAAALLATFCLLAFADTRRDGRFFVGAAFLWGLTLGIHVSAFAYIGAALALWAIIRRPGLTCWLKAAAAAALGASAVIYLPVRAAAGTPLPWTWATAPDARMFLAHVTGRQFSYNFRWPTGTLARYELEDLAAATWRNLGPLAFIAPVGLWALWRRRRLFAGIIAASLALNVAFLLVYDIPDIASYRLTFIALTALLAAVAALTLFASLRNRYIRVGTGALAAAAVAAAVAGRWETQARRPSFIEYYSRGIMAPAGFGAMYVSGATTSNFLYWFRQLTLGQRPDVELYNINDARYDIDKLAALIWHELGARPVFADYLFISETQERKQLYERAKSYGFLVELVDHETADEPVQPWDRDAIARAEALLRDKPDDPDAPSRGEELALDLLQNHGSFHEYRGETERALYYFMKSAEIAPYSNVALSNLARWLWQQKNYEASGRAAEAAIRADRRTSAGYAYLSFAKLAAEDYDNALAAAKMAVALKPQDGKTHRVLAGAYLARGEREAAVKEMERTLARGYNDPDTIILLAKIYRDDGREEDAFELLRRTAHKINDPRILNAYALALIERGRYAEAKTELLRAYKLAPRSPQIRENLARLEAMGW
jgi:Flp pilus assembly protein TadD